MARWAILSDLDFGYFLKIFSFEKGKLEDIFKLKKKAFEGSQELDFSSNFSRIFSLTLFRSNLIDSIIKINDS